MSLRAGIRYSEDRSWWWDGTQWRAVSTDPPPSDMDSTAAVPEANVDLAPQSKAVPIDEQPSVIALTWPHRFLQVAPTTSNTYAVPCQGLLMDAHEVARLVVALPLVRLWRYGIISLTLDSSQGPNRFTTALPLQQAQVWGIEAELIAAMRRTKVVNDVVIRWIAKTWKDPWEHTCSRAASEGLKTGAYTRVETKPGKAMLEPSCEHSASLEPQANALAEIWSEFAATQPGLYPVLLNDVEAGIAWRTQAWHWTAGGDDGGGISIGSD